MRPWRYADKYRKRVYIASRYAGDTAANTAAAVRFCRFAVQNGCLPIAPHLLYPQILDDNEPDERRLGLMFGLALLSNCHELWVFANPLPWAISSGMIGEIREARRLMIPIRRFDENMREIPLSFEEVLAS